MIEQYNDVLPEDEWFECYNKLSTAKNWAFEGVSFAGNIEEEFMFWHMDLMDDDFFTSYMFDGVKKLVGKNVFLERVYANGQTYGLPGYMHVDSDSDNYYTFLYYPNKIWHPMWGGSTVFAHESGEIDTYHYTPNGGLLFKGNIPHVGMEPTRHYRLLRISVAFKLKLID